MAELQRNFAIIEFAIPYSDFRYKDIKYNHPVFSQPGIPKVTVKTTVAIVTQYQHSTQGNIAQ
ncbi:MAG: hypothetical protein PHT78_13225 [Desulfitobacteriaceae bacterium]|nr:hypothetical protein [Desulfitobacteriaceae bacterium]